MLGGRPKRSLCREGQQRFTNRLAVSRFQWRPPFFHCNLVTILSNFSTGIRCAWQSTWRSLTINLKQCLQKTFKNSYLARSSGLLSAGGAVKVQEVSPQVLRRAHSMPWVLPKNMAPSQGVADTHHGRCAQRKQSRNKFVHRYTVVNSKHPTGSFLVIWSPFARRIPMPLPPLPPKWSGKT